MINKSYQKDIIIIILCGLVVGLLIFLLMDKYKELTTRQSFMTDYTHIAETVHMPQKYDIVNDSMQGPLINEILKQELDYTQDDIGVHQDALRANLFLLTKDFQAARQQLGSKKNADDRYDQATIDLLQARYLSATGDIETMVLSYDLVQQSRGGLEIAQSLQPDDSLQEKITHNSLLAGELIRLLGIKLVTRRWEDMAYQLKQMIYALDVLERLLGEVAVLLNTWEPLDTTCKKELQQYLELVSNDLTMTSFVIQDNNINLLFRFAGCFALGDECVSLSAVIYEKFLTVMEMVMTTIKNYHTNFSELDELLLIGDDGPLLAFCIDHAALDEDTQGNTSLSVLMEQLLATSVLGESMSGTGSTDDDILIHTPLDKDREEYLLDEIEKKQGERLEQKRHLEQEPGYMPQQLLDDMFQQFEGNDEGFDREVGN